MRRNKNQSRQGGLTLVLTTPYGRWLWDPKAGSVGRYDNKDNLIETAHFITVDDNTVIGAAKIAAGRENRRLQKEQAESKRRVDQST
jgi:hypothetical protein